MSDSLSQLQTKLREMFEFDNHDLNFGIYKIYNLKNEEVRQFIEGDDERSLQKIIQRSLSQTQVQAQENERILLRQFLGRYNKQDLLEDLKANHQKIAAEIEMDGEEEEGSLLKALESLLDPDTDAVPADKVYNHLLNFFGLYYSNGDFGYNTRSLSPYQVNYPDAAEYNGDDTMLMWKHKDQYYIKSGAGFNRVSFELTIGDETKTVEYRLTSNESEQIEGTARNNNKDAQTKHYRLDQIKVTEDTVQVLFQLASESTPKVEIYQRILQEGFEVEFPDPYWHRSNGKSAFNELSKDNQKVEGGSIRGVKQLRQNKEDLLKYLNEGVKKTDELDKLSETDEIFTVLWSLNKSLNNFYIGNDADFFIHPDLRGFLTRERDKYVKNQILSDLSTLLQVQRDNRSLLVAQAFVLASDPLIEFLAAVENFQKQLFERPKHVVESNYLIAAGKIDAQHYPALIQNKALVENWRELGFVEKKVDANFLTNHPTLPVDTKYLDTTLKDEILAGIPDLETDTNGLLINSENFQALNFLKQKYRGKIKCIYIDPPYNSENDGFLYKDNFKHSSWLSFMENRLELARDLLTEDGLIFVSIDYRENYRLRHLLESKFKFINEISWKKYSGVKNNATNKLTTQHETIFLYGKSDKYNFEVVYNPLSESYVKNEYKYVDDNGRRFAKLRGRGYQGEEGTTKIKYLDEALGSPVTSLWSERDLQLSTSSAEKLKNLLGTDTAFEGQKPIALVQRITKITSSNNINVLDFFAGSGTTGHAVMNLNQEDGGSRKFLEVEMGEYFETILKPRTAKVMYTANWKNGRPHGEITGTPQIVKYLTLEQYEDVLDNLDKAPADFPEGVEYADLPLRYWYMPESLQLETRLDLARPFAQRTVVGQTHQEATLNLGETYLYRAGYAVKSRRRFDFADAPNEYLAYLVGRGGEYRTSVMFRTLTPEQASQTNNVDIENLKTILTEYPTVERLEVNADIHVLALENNSLRVGERMVQVKRISNHHFSD